MPLTVGNMPPDGDETVAAGRLSLPTAPDAPAPAPSPSGAGAPVPSDFSIAWAQRQGWVGSGQLEALRRKWDGFDRIPDVPRVLIDSGLITLEQKHELMEVVALSQSVPSVRLRRRLGAGAMGGVYLGRTVDTDQQVAVKVLHDEIADQDETRARFEREISTLARLNHPGIPRLYGHDCDAKVPYCIMEYVPGVTLGELQAEAGALPESYVLWVAIQVAQTLHHAYRRGGALVHRDIKPDNIIVQLPEGTRPESLFTSRHPIKIIDFGLARPQQSEASLTMTGMVVGTPRYMAPEQIRCEELDWRADLYALGATCYHLLTGRVPFGGTSTAEVMVAHLNDPAPDPGKAVPALSRRSCGIVLRSMSKEREARFPDYKSFIQACEQALAAFDDRPVVLLRKPFVKKVTQKVVHPRPTEGGGAPQKENPLEGESNPSRSGAVRGRVQRSYSEKLGSDRVPSPQRSGEVVGQAASAPGATPAQRHDEVFGGVEAEAPVHESAQYGATEALRCVLQARVRGEATELDIDDLDGHSRRLRHKTDAIIDKSAGVRPSILPLLLLAVAAVLFLGILVLHFL